VPWLLHDLAADPFEQHNLIGTAEASAIAPDLHAALVALLDRTGDDYALAPAWGHPGRAVVHSLAASG
jgi:hypothetical protein